MSNHHNVYLTIVLVQVYLNKARVRKNISVLIHLANSDFVVHLTNSNHFSNTKCRIVESNNTTLTSIEYL